MGLMEAEDGVDFPIVTEMKRVTRSSSRSDYRCDGNENETHIDRSKKIVQEFAHPLLTT